MFRDVVSTTKWGIQCIYTGVRAHEITRTTRVKGDF